MLNESLALWLLREIDKEGLRDEWDSVLHVIDERIIVQRISNVKANFPESAIHTVAVKANPLLEILKTVVREGFGLECASAEEVTLSLQADATFIAWDSPVKTALEMRTLAPFGHRILLSCNDLMEASAACSAGDFSNVLLRINPQQSSSAHASMQVGSLFSKFGEPISHRRAIIDFACHHDGLTGLHVHASSQTEQYSELVAAIRSTLNLALEINQVRAKPLTWINIGGGFPVDFDGQAKHDMSRYASLLKAECPELFDGTFRIITEFGRYYHANAGFSAIQIAAVKAFDALQVIIGHAGADMFLRECYQPGQWPHRTAIASPDWTLPQGALINTHLAGPLCFGGDYISRDALLPSAVAGDWVIMLDTGANSVGLWSKHCSRAFPKCLSFNGNSVRVIRERDSMSDAIATWGISR